MDWGYALDNLGKVGDALSGTFAAIGLGAIYYQQKRGERHTNFVTYTKEYAEVRARMPEDFYKLPLDKGIEDKKECKAVSEMVNVFAREHSLWMDGGVTKHHWKWWQRGMVRFLAAPHGRRVWEEINRSEIEGYPEFTDPFRKFMNSLLEQFERETALRAASVPASQMNVPFMLLEHEMLQGGTVAANANDVSLYDQGLIAEEEHRCA